MSTVGQVCILPVASSHFQNAAKRPKCKREGSPLQSCFVPLEILQALAAICCRLFGEGRRSRASPVSLLFCVTGSGLAMTALHLGVRWFVQIGHLLFPRPLGLRIQLL